MRIVERTIPNSKYRKLDSWLDDIILPFLREARRVINGRFGEIVSISADYICGPNDEVVLADTSTIALNLYLPEATGCIKTIIAKNLGANNLVVRPNSVDTTLKIDGVASYTLAALNDKAQFITNGSNWYTI